MIDIDALAAAAIPANDDDWGSERQIAAENLFFEAVNAALDDDDRERLETYCLKATSEEMVAEGLRLYRREAREEGMDVSDDVLEERHAAARAMLAALETMVTRTNAVIDAWEKGDLANTVNRLRIASTAHAQPAIVQAKAAGIGGPT